MVYLCPGVKVKEICKPIGPNSKPLDLHDDALSTELQVSIQKTLPPKPYGSSKIQLIENYTTDKSSYDITRTVLLVNSQYSHYFRSLLHLSESRTIMMRGRSIASA